MRVSASLFLVVALLFTAALAASVSSDDAVSSVMDELDSLSSELDIEVHDAEDLSELEDALYQKLSAGLKDKVKKATKKVKDTSKKVVTKTKDTAKKAKEKTKDAAKTVKSKTSNAGKKVKDGATKAGKKIKEGAEKTGKKIKEGAEKAGEKIKETWELTESIVKAGVNKLKKWGDTTFNKIKKEIEDLLPEKLKFLAELFTNPVGFAKKATECSNPVVGHGKAGCVASFFLQQFKANSISSRSFLQTGETMDLSTNAASTAAVDAEAEATWNWANWEDNANGYVPQTDLPYMHRYICNSNVKTINGDTLWEFTPACGNSSRSNVFIPSSTYKSSVPGPFSITGIKMNDNSCLDCQCKSNSQSAEILTAFNDVILGALVAYESITDIARGVQIFGLFAGATLRITASSLRSECIRFGLNQ